MGSRRNKSGLSPLGALESVNWDWLPLSAILQDQRLQKRQEGLDGEHVKRLLGTLEDDGDITEPVVVFRDEDGILWLADGFHRMEAYKQAGRDQIRANVRTGSYDDAEVFAENANLKHAKALSTASRQAIFKSRVLRGYETNGITWAKLSDGAIASELGVDRKTVGNWFEELREELTGEFSPVAVNLDRAIVYGRDGREYRLENVIVENQRRAEEFRKQKEAEEAERRERDEAERIAKNHAMSAVEKFEYLMEWLLLIHNPRMAKAGKAFWVTENEAEKDYEYFMQVVQAWKKDPSIRLSFEEAKQWIHEFGDKTWVWYVAHVGDMPAEVYEQARVEQWDETRLEQWAQEAANKAPFNTEFHPGQASGLDLPGEKRAAEMASQKEDYKPAQPRGDVFPRSSPRQPVKSGRFAIGQTVYIKATQRKAAIVRAFWGGSEWKYVLDHNLTVAFWESELLAMNEAREVDPNAAKFRVGDIVRLLATGEIDEVVSFTATADGFEYILADGDADITFNEDELEVYRLKESQEARKQEIEARFARMNAEVDARLAPNHIPTPDPTPPLQVDGKEVTRPNAGYADHRKANYALWEISSACDQIAQGFGKLLGITRAHVIDSLTLGEMKDVKKRFDQLNVVGTMANGNGQQRLADLYGIFQHFIETKEIVDWFAAGELEGWTETSEVSNVRNEA